MPESAPSITDNSGAKKFAIFVHASGSSAPAREWIEHLVAMGSQVFSQGAIDGTVQTRADLENFNGLVNEILSVAPNRHLLILRHPLRPDAGTLNELALILDNPDLPDALSTLSNASPISNPFANLATAHVLSGSAADRSRRVKWVKTLAAGEFHEQDQWQVHLLALSSSLLSRMKDDGNADDLPAMLGTTVQIADWLYVEDPSQSPFNGPEFEPHETPYPAPWAVLSERLDEVLLADKLTLEALDNVAESSLVTLHITHSWGGGVATWVESFIDGDQQGTNLQLRSEGPQSGRGAGQRLSLYAGNHLDVALDHYWLFPAIKATVDQHDSYRAALNEICARFGVGRIIVSSLVGHSLDALRANCPTVQVLHDHYPVWPLLGIHPLEYQSRLKEALLDARALEPFGPIHHDQWLRLVEHYQAACENVIRVAPSHATYRLQAELDPSLDAKNERVIEHGLPPLPMTDVTPREPGSRKLRLVIPGRIQSGKGAQLLEEALPGLAAIAHITLLGCGKSGERFFGRSGVNVILNYDRAALPELLQKIAPDAAALLSVVPETFSYTLSEMSALGIPVIATRLGSFSERIVENKSGWLIDPTPVALVDKASHLARSPAEIESARTWLKQQKPRSPQDMIRDYAALCPGEVRSPINPRKTSIQSLQSNIAGHADSVMRSRQALRHAEHTADSLKEMVKERTAWAERMNRSVAEVSGQLATREEQLTVADQELLDRTEHIERQNFEIERQNVEIGQQNSEISRIQDLLERSSMEVRSLSQQFNALSDLHNQVLNSHSWKITRPMRVGRRVVGQLVHLKAWNPMRWPLLTSQLARNLSTVGIKGTLSRAQYADTTSAPIGELTGTSDPAQKEAEIPHVIPRSERPLVSIVIPAFNHLDHTANCLSSIAKAIVNIPFEVILVDDASSDDTQHALENLKGLRYQRNPENLGFIGSSNHGAELARGEFVVMLNNDTQVHDGWLDKLIGTFDQYPDAGLVGARLIYPDGTLQECGGMVFNDGSGWNLGRGDNPDLPDYQSVREVDYCSGACIVIRRDLLTELGGFDPYYTPAYYEDTDLAFKVRQAGLKVYVQPAASVVHFEGVSSGTDLQSGVKKYQVTNRQKFIKRWADELKRQPNPIQNPQDQREVRAARDHKRVGRVLLIDAYTPEPDQDSGSVRLVNLMQCLVEMGLGVTFFADNRAWADNYTMALQDMGVEVWYDPWLTSTQEFLVQRGAEFDHVIVSRHYIAQNYLSVLKRYAPQANFIFDTVDLHYLREMRQAELENSAVLHAAAKQTRRAELAVINEADATLVVSPVERTLLAQDAPDAPVYVLSNIHEVKSSNAGFEQRKDIYFVGGYQHPPNVDAACWFVQEIWPIVHTALPGVEFHLIGSKAPDRVKALEADGLVFHGFVETLEPFLEHCRLSVAPLRYGAGVKGKVNQAMAHGQPVVATPTAVEGIHAVHELDVLVAEDAQGFAAEVIRLYQDQVLWESIAKNALANVEAHFSKAAAKQDIQILLDGLDKAGK